jgi:hypothetical protein
MNQLADELVKKINLLQSGKLNTADTDELVSICANLYEKLIILRYKAYTEPQEIDGANEDINVSDAPITIDSSPLIESQNQVNLIDAIAEAEQEEEEPVHFQLISEEIEVTDISELTQPSETTLKQEPIINIQVDSEPTSPDPIILKEERVSLNESFMSNTSASLAQKLEGSPISDLKKNISLNQRFQFCKDLFKGNNQEYEEMVEKLNNTNKDEALRILDVLNNKYSWNSDSNAVRDFTDLVNRRYL